MPTRYYKTVITVDDKQSQAAAARSKKVWEEAAAAQKKYAEGVQSGMAKAAKAQVDSAKQAAKEHEKSIANQQKAEQSLHDYTEKLSQRDNVARARWLERREKALEQTAAKQLKSEENLHDYTEKLSQRDNVARARWLERREAATAKATQKEVDFSWRAWNERSKARTRTEMAEERETAGAEKRNARNAASSEKIAISWRSIAIGIYAAARAGHAFGQSIDKAVERSKQLANAFVTDQDKQRELAGLMGRTVDSNFGVEQAGIAKQMLMKPEEALAFQVGVRNSGAEYIGPGKSLSETEAQVYTRELGKFVTTRGLDPGALGEFGGTMIGTKDWSKAGGGRAAARETALNFAILQHGRGGNRELAQQDAKILAAYMNEDETKGVFSDPRSATIAASMFAEFDPQKSATMLRSATRVFSDYEGKSADFLAEAGIKPGMSWLEKAEQMGAWANKRVAQERKAGRNLTTMDVIRQGVGGGTDRQSMLATEALTTLANKATGPRGLIAERQRYAGTMATPGVLEGEQTAFEATPAGRNRAVDAGLKLEEAIQGAAGGAVNLARKEALLRLVKRHQWLGTEQNIENLISGAMTFGALGNMEQRQIDTDVMRNLEAGGATFGRNQKGQTLPFTEEGRQEFLGKGIDEVNANLRKQTEMMQQDLNRRQIPGPLVGPPNNAAVQH